MKEQLLKITQEYKVEVDTMLSTGRQKNLLCGTLQESLWFGENRGKSVISVVTVGLSFDQQK